MTQKPTNLLQVFAETHNLSNDVVEELAADLKSHQRRRTVLVIVIVLIVSSLLGIFLLKRISSKTPQVVNTMSNQRWTQFEEIAKLRLSEGFDLSHRIYDFTSALFQDSVPAAKLRKHWQAGQADLGSLSADLKDLPNAPIDASKRLLGTGPSRIQSVIARASAAAEILRQWIPTILGSLDEIKPGGDKIKQVLGILDARLRPFILDTILDARWRELHDDILNWVVVVGRDIDAARNAMNGEEMSVEFTRRLGRAILGLR